MKKVFKSKLFVWPFLMGLLFIFTGCLTDNNRYTNTLQPVKYSQRVVNFGFIEFLSEEVAVFTLEGKIHPLYMKRLWLASERLKITKVKELRILMMSPGGYAFCAVPLAGLVEKLHNQGIKVKTYACGMVASAAVPMFVIADERIAAPGTLFMIHKVSVPGGGEINPVYERQITQDYINILADHSRLSRESIRRMMDETTWFTAEEAFEWGFVDRIE